MRVGYGTKGSRQVEPNTLVRTLEGLRSATPESGRPLLIIPGHIDMISLRRDQPES